MAAAPTHLFQPLADPSPTNDNGAAISQLFRDGGPGTTVLLVPRAVYPLYTAIDFSHPSTHLATEGYPTFESGNQAILETRGEKEAGAVKMFQLARTSLKRVHLRGCRGWGPTPPTDDHEKERLRHQGNLGWLEGGGALVWMGGPEAYESTVEGCRIEDPRGWTGLHLVDYAQRCQVLDNIVGPCGQQAPGPWADGLSIAGKDSLVAGNTVIDATDGAIVLFCAPGSVVTRNTIIARERNLLGAINMVDDFPFDRNFEGTKVIGNSIKTEGAFIRLAIGCGPTCWSPWGPGHTLNYGGAVLDNYLGPGQFGYGIALSGARQFKVHGNRVMSDTRFAGSTHRFYPATVNAPPTAFLRQWCDRGRVQGCDYQDDFVEGEVQWLIGIEPEVGDKLEYEAGQVRMDVHGHSRAGEGGLALKGGRWEVTEQGELILRRVDQGQQLDRFGMGQYGRGTVMWTSGGGTPVRDPILEFRKDGALTLRADRGNGETLWDPVSYLSDFLPAPPPVPEPSEPTPPETWISRAKLILQAKKPYLQVKNHQGNLLFSSSYDWTNQDNWGMIAGQWLAIAPAEIRGYEEPGSEHGHQAPAGGGPSPPQVPARPEQQHDEHHHGGSGGRFGRFVKDVSASLQERGIDMPAFVQQSFPNYTSPHNDQHEHPDQPGGPPPIPPRPGSRPRSAATFLYLSPDTCQLILHSSPAGPTRPDPEHTHWKVPAEPVNPVPKDAWLSFQGDGNVVMYAGGGVPWASMTNGDRCADRLVLKANGEEGGPAFELRAKDGSIVFTSQQQ
ncbi:uncharacterized protein JCM15063_001886 [Sporobolomyces koalae]|uniref:uncharacterized protein n=1 Tax=Sporobolomyces koalae TaxID=500713 RepID=UPI00316DED62